MNRVLASLAVLSLCACGPESIVVQMGELNGSKQTGTAILTAKGDHTEVVIDISPPTGSTEPQDAHIHYGDCPGLGEIYEGLHQVEAGKSTTVIPVSLATLHEQPYAVNVHNAAATGYVSCGEIPHQ